MSKETVLLLGPNPGYRDPDRPLAGGFKALLEQCPPLNLPILKTVLEGHGLGVQTGSLNRPKELTKTSENVQCALISSRSIDTPLAITAAKLLAEQGIFVVFGGYGPTLMPDLFQQEVPPALIFQGEVEERTEILIKGLANKEPGIAPPSQRHPDLFQRYILPDRTSRSSLLIQSLELGRGCQNKCADFCSAAIIQGKPRQRNPEEVIREIDLIVWPFPFYKILFILDING